jgi:hypothetical protein
MRAEPLAGPGGKDAAAADNVAVPQAAKEPVRVSAQKFNYVKVSNREQ